MTATPAALPPARLGSATMATYAAFIGSGFAFASWASRIPQVKSGLSLSPSQLGLVLLAIAVGSMTALPLAGHLVDRIGPRRTVSATALILAAGLAIAACGFLVGVVPVVAGLWLFGLGNGAWDVAMNVHAARVEQLLGRSIMSRFHAGFSVGTVGGALVGAAMVAGGVPVTAHLLAVAVVIAVGVPLSVRNFVPEEPARPPGDPHDGAPRENPWRAWREPRTLLVGTIVLAFAFGEGTGNDWISVSLIDGYAARPVIGTLTLAGFLAAMTTGRWVGPWLLDRYGRVTVIRTLSVLAVAGLALYVFGGSIPLAAAGALVWGFGVSLGFPVGMSAAADDPAHAPARVSVAASIGYCAFLGGPPAIGFLGQHFTVLHALTAVAVLLGVAALVTGQLAPLRPADSRADGQAPSRARA